MPERHAQAGRRIAGAYVATLDGVQADQEYVRTLFNLQRVLALFHSFSRPYWVLGF